MKKQIMLDFYRVFGYEPTAEVKNLINELLGVWGKFDKQVAKNPALVRKSIWLGISLADEMRKGNIKPRASVKPTEEKTVTMREQMTNF